MRSLPTFLVLAGALLLSALLPAAAHAGPGLTVDITGTSITVDENDVEADGPLLVNNDPVAYSYKKVRWELQADDAVQYECVSDVNGTVSPAVPCPPSFTSEVIYDGVYILTVRAASVASPTEGDWGPSATFTWNADITAPQPAVTYPGIGAGNLTNDVDATLEFSAVNPTTSADETSDTQFFYQYDGAGTEFPLMPGVTTVTRNGLSDGDYSLSVWAQDPAGNKSAVPATIEWTVDATPPVVGPLGRTGTGTPNPTYGPDQSLTFASEPGAVFECRLTTPAQPSPSWEACASPLERTGLADGSYMLGVRAIDAATNVSAERSASWTVDTTAPVATVIPGPLWRATDDRRTSHLFALVSGEDVGYECRLDAGAWAPCTSPHAVDGLTSGDHTLDVRATDAAGHVSAVASKSWTTALLRAESDGPAVGRPDGSATVKWTGNASSYECSVDSGSWTPCASPLELAGLGNGGHDVRVKGRDDGVEDLVLTLSFVVNRSVALPPVSDPGAGPGGRTVPPPTSTDPVRIGLTTTGKSKSVRFDAKGQLKLQSTCTAEAGCAATRAKWTMTIGKKRYTGSFVIKKREAGKPANVTLKLSSKARKALAKSKKGGKLVVTSGTSKLTLKASAAKAKSKGKRGKSSKKRAARS